MLTMLHSHMKILEIVILAIIAGGGLRKKEVQLVPHYVDVVWEHWTLGNVLVIIIPPPMSISMELRLAWHLLVTVRPLKLISKMVTSWN